jgi:hypothetical protein
MASNQPSYEFSLSIPPLICGLQISLRCRVGLLAVDSKSAQLFFSVVLKIINLR